MRFVQLTPPGFAARPPARSNNFAPSSKSRAERERSQKIGLSEDRAGEKDHRDQDDEPREHVEQRAESLLLRAKWVQHWFASHYRM
jgi:hypothetical protein